MNSFRTDSANPPQEALPSKKSFLKIALTMSILIVLSFLIVTFVKLASERPGDDNPHGYPMRTALGSMFPDMNTLTEENGIFVLNDSSEKTVGYAFVASGKGYGGDISILVGLQDASIVKGIYIISQTETAGLGSRITLPRFTDQFMGKRIEDIRLKSEGGRIDGITGSTISSQAVINAVRETALEKAANLTR